MVTWLRHALLRLVLSEEASGPVKWKAESTVHLDCHYLLASGRSKQDHTVSRDAGRRQAGCSPRLDKLSSCFGLEACSEDLQRCAVRDFPGRTARMSLSQSHLRCLIRSAEGALWALLRGASRVQRGCEDAESSRHPRCRETPNDRKHRRLPRSFVLRGPRSSLDCCGHGTSIVPCRAKFNEGLENTSTRYAIYIHLL